jgi:hypothetical protein
MPFQFLHHLYRPMPDHIQGVIEPFFESQSPQHPCVSSHTGSPGTQCSPQYNRAAICTRRGAPCMPVPSSTKTLFSIAVTSSGLVIPPKRAAMYSRQAGSLTAQQFRLLRPPARAAHTRISATTKYSRQSNRSGVKAIYGAEYRRYLTSKFPLTPFIILIQQNSVIS